MLRANTTPGRPGGPSRGAGPAPFRKRPGSGSGPQSDGPSAWRGNAGNWISALLFALLLLWVWQESFHDLSVRDIPYSQFKAAVQRREVADVHIGETAIYGRIEPRAEESGATAPGEPTPQPPAPSPSSPSPLSPSHSSDEGAKPGAAGKSDAYNFRTTRVEDPALVEQLERSGVAFRGERPSVLQEIILSWILPLGLIALLWVFISRRVASAGPSLLNFGRSRARLVADRDTGVTFADVAGCDEAKTELQEVVDFLQRPDRYRALGARIPKGVLLVGPPGTGKTLIARAVAGEARVPFFSLSGSDFVEMFVGVGAARVRDLFEQAKKAAPCIVFIDELDAIGRQRGVHIGSSNDEREQTLNQLLVEMDGFEPNVGVIVLAATNRPDVLDRALLRPGRFDRQVVIDAPDAVGREAILRVHARSKPLASDVDLATVARATPGFSGADLANVMNEAALLAAREGAQRITQKHLEEAVEKVMAGPERRSRRLSEEDKRRVAYHEVGHALVAAHSAHADPVHKISIVPRGRAALGYTLQLPEGQQFLMSRAELIDRLNVLLGGRAAESLVFPEVSTGAADDLERATAMAREMIAVYGMGRSVGLVHCAKPRLPAVLGVADSGLERDCSDATAREIDEEVKLLLDQAFTAARAILQEHRSELDTVAQALIQRETLDGAAFRELIQKKKKVSVG